MHPKSTTTTTLDVNANSVVESEGDESSSGTSGNNSRRSKGSDSGEGSSTTTSHAGSGSGGSSSESSSIWSKTAKVEKFVLGQTESRYVFFLKLVVLGLLVLSGMYMSRVTFAFVETQQEDKFIDQVRNDRKENENENLLDTAWVVIVYGGRVSEAKTQQSWAFCSQSLVFCGLGVGTREESSSSF
jgi:hypothetical protein